MTSPHDDRDLIQADIDGTADESERAAVRARAASDPTFAKELERMRDLAAVLERVEPVVPPPDLAEGILRAVRTAPAEDRRGILARLWDALPSSRSVVPYAYAAAVGAAACFLALQAVGWGIPGLHGVRPAEAVGTMAPVAGEVLGRVDLGSAGLPGTASARRADGGTAIQVVLDNGARGAVGLRFDPAAVGVVSIGAPESRLGRVDVTSGLVSFTASDGGEVTVLLEPLGTGPAEVSVDVAGSDGERKQAGTLRITPEGGPRAE